MLVKDAMGHETPRNRQALATAAAILLDKYRLEMGEVTARSESASVDEMDREIESLAAKMRGHGAHKRYASREPAPVEPP